MNFARPMELNNVAVACLEMRRHHSATKCLREAIQELKRELAEECLDECDMDIDDDALPVIHAVPLSEDARQSSNDDAIVAPFRSALHIEECGDDEELVTGVILFNWGLSLHCQGIDEGNSQQLCDGLKLYEMALAVVLKMPHRCSSANLLFLALSNNMAHIHALTMDTAKMRHSIQGLRALLSSGRITPTSADTEEYSVFFRNAFFLRGGEMTRAPAA